MRADDPFAPSLDPTRMNDVPDRRPWSGSPPPWSGSRPRSRPAPSMTGSPPAVDPRAEAVAELRRAIREGDLARATAAAGRFPARFSRRTPKRPLLAEELAAINARRPSTTAAPASTRRGRPVNPDAMPARSATSFRPCWTRSPASAIDRELVRWLMTLLDEADARRDRRARRGRPGHPRRGELRPPARGGKPAGLVADPSAERGALPPLRRALSRGRGRLPEMSRGLAQDRRFTRNPDLRKLDSGPGAGKDEGGFPVRRGVRPRATATVGFARDRPRSPWNGSEKERPDDPPPSPRPDAGRSRDRPGQHVRDRPVPGRPGREA